MPASIPDMSYLRETIVAQTPPSLALVAVERYLNSKHNELNLTVPLKTLGLPTDLELERPVRVEFMTKGRNKLMLGRRDEHLQLQWKPEGPYPSFSGTLTVQPLSGGTQIELRGSYKPPFGPLGAAFDTAIGYRIAHATASTLLTELKGELERDFEAVKATIETAP